MDLGYVPWDDPEDTASTKAILNERIKGACATQVQQGLPSVGQSREHGHRAGLVHHRELGRWPVAHGVPRRGIADGKVKEVAGELRGRGISSMLLIDGSPGPNTGPAWSRYSVIDF